jgi:dTDP-4-amino-4,6-dideoxygalactose transaminase
MPGKISRVDLTAQYLAYKDEIDAVVRAVLHSGRYTLGEEVGAFEREFGAYLGVGDFVSVADGTRAIAMALTALGVRPGDEVITTAFTAVPTIGAILETGARPVFADVDADTYLLDHDSVMSRVTSKTRAVVPVHMFGNVFDIPRLRAGLPKGVVIVEDAAQAHGATLDDRKAGGFGDLATFSFYPTKNLGGYGDGGGIVSNDPDLSRKLRLVRNHGMHDKDICATPGVNSRLDELQAAILRVKLRHLDAMNEARADRARQYNEGLPAARFAPQRIAANVRNNWHVYQARVLDSSRDALVAHLDAKGVQSNIYYVVPHHLQPAFAFLGYKEGDLPSVEALCRQAIALPLYPEIDPQIVDQVIAQICGFYGTRGRAA